MSIETAIGVPIERGLLGNYFQKLINLFFKILPIWESTDECGKSTLGTYMQSLQAELLGCKSFVLPIHNDSAFLTLIAVLQYLIDNPNLEVPVVKREVFRCISICKKLQARYASGESEVKTK